MKAYVKLQAVAKKVETLNRKFTSSSSISFSLKPLFQFKGKARGSRFGNSNTRENPCENVNLQNIATT